jgi:hypothetical protein
MNLLLAMLLLIAPAAADEPTWARTTVPGSTVSLELPGAVETRHVEKLTAVGTVISDTLVVEPDGGWMAATVTQAPRLALKFAGSSTVLKQARKSVLSDTKGKLLTWEPVARGGHDGMRMTFSLIGENGAAQDGVSEIYTWDGYVVTFTAALEPKAAATTQRFHGSIQF